MYMYVLIGFECVKDGVVYSLLVLNTSELVSKHVIGCVLRTHMYVSNT